MTDPTAGERIGPINAEVTRPNLTGQRPAEPDPNGGYTDQEVAAIVARTRVPADPDAGDVEALAKVLTDLPVVMGPVRVRRDEALTLTRAEALAVARQLAPVLDAVRRKAGDERAEQIAQAIRATDPNGSHVHRAAYDHAARIAEETR